MIRLIMLALALGFGTVSAQETVGGFTFNETQLKNRYIQDFRRWATEDAEKTPARDAVLCVGSSSMRMWRTIKRDLTPLKIIHRGFGGSTMSQVLLFKDFFARYEPETVIVYEGDNDLWGSTTPETFLEQCQSFVAAMQAARSDTVFYFLPAKPCPARVKKWEKFTRSNQMLKAYCEATENLKYIDVATPMMGEDGTVMPDLFVGDRLHMNPKGYAIWTRTVRGALGLPVSKYDLGSTMIQDWHCLGAFPSDQEFSGFDKVFPPEEDVDLMASYTGSNDETIQWQRVQLSGKDKLGWNNLDFSKLFAGVTEDAVAYAYTEIVSDKDQTVTLYSGSDDTITIWVNGEKVMSEKVARGVVMDSDETSGVQLNKGTNKILVKVCQGMGGWGMCLRIANAEGEPLVEGVQYGFEN